MKQILFPTDFSKASFNALPFALHLAELSKAEITTLHAYLPTLTQPEVSDPFTVEALELLQFEKYREAAEMMHRKALEVHHADIEIQHILEEGFPVETLLEQAGKLPADAIVMGSKGASGVAAALLGSTASAVVEKSACPVFVIPDDYDFRPVRKIGLAIDFFESKREYVDRLIDYTALFDATLTCFHIDTSLSDAAEERAETWREQYSEKISFEVVRNNYVLDGINAFVEEQPFDLLAMITRKHSFLQHLFRVSYTKKMSMHSRLPLCVIKA